MYGRLVCKDPTTQTNKAKAISAVLLELNLMNKLEDVGKNRKKLEETGKNKKK